MRFPVALIGALIAVAALVVYDVTEAPAARPVAPMVAEEMAATVPALSADASFLALAVPFVGRWEGLRLDAYLDPVGIPTVCYGETKGVEMGDSYSKAECDAMFSRELLAYRQGLHKHLTAETKVARMPVKRDVAYTSLTYNIGVGAVSRSTAVKRLNAGNIAGGCEAINWWDKAGGRVLRGLVLRRGAEYDLCMDGIR